MRSRQGKPGRLNSARLRPGRIVRAALLSSPLLVAFAPVQAVAQDRAQYQTNTAVTAGFAAERDTESGLPPSLNDWGETGLIQDPSARVGLEGDFHFTLSNVNPYTRYNFTLSPTPWLETAFRYTNIMNRFYGPSFFSGSQRYKDRAFDLKFRLVKENQIWPEIALGFRDIAGTGLFSSQYLVANRRWYDLDFTAGIAWGNMANGSSIPNPLGLLSNHFKRPTASFGSSGGAGTFNPKAYFTGPDIGLFGGIEWQTPIKNLRAKLEYDPNNYHNEPFDNRFQDNLPVNFDLEYNPSPVVTLAAGIERGKTGMLRLSVHANFNDLKGLLPIRDTPPPPIKIQPHAAPEWATAPRALKPKIQNRIASAIFQQLSKQHLTGTRFAIAGHTAYLVFENNAYRPTAMAIGRAARIVANNAPPQVEQLDLTLVTGAITDAHLTLYRHDLEQAFQNQGSPEEIWHHTELDRDVAQPPPGTPVSTPNDLYPKLTWGLEPRLRQQVGGPNSFLIFQLYAALSGEAELRKGLTVSGTFAANIYNNFNQLTLSSNSTLPHVRSDIKDYLQKGANGIFRLQADQIWPLAPSWYARLSGGVLEEMFEGADSEILYRPENARYALSLDVNHVYQRGFDELFDRRQYQVTTGNLNLYYQYSPQTLITLSAGKYLAGDKGATITIQKTFDSGITTGIFATKTNVSSAQFGEGSFDKGFFISIPLDSITGSRTTSTGGYLYRPLTRDGGQQLDINKPLYFQTQSNSPKSISESWNNVMQ